MIKKYVKKPVVVEAMQWTGHNIDEIYSFIGASRASFPRQSRDGDCTDLCIETTEGSYDVSVKDFIIKVSENVFRICKPDTFHDTYTDITGRDVYFSIEAKL